MSPGAYGPFKPRRRKRDWTVIVEVAGILAILAAGLLLWFGTA